MSRPGRRPRFSLAATSLAALALLLPGCGLHGGGSDTTAACDNIRTEVAGVQSKFQQADDPGQLAQAITASAGKVRQEGEAAGGDVEVAAEKVAANMDQLARYLTDLAAGQAGQADLSALDGSAEELYGQACKGGGLHG